MEKGVKNLAILCCILAASAAYAGQSDLTNLWLPGNTWAVKADLTGFEVNSQDISPQLNARLLAASDFEGRILLTIYLDPVEKEITAAQCRDDFLSNFSEQKVRLENVEQREDGDIAFLSYELVGYEKVSDFRQPNAFAFLVKDSTSIFVHVSTIDEQPGDHELIDHLMRSLRVVENYEPSAYDCFLFASTCYMQEDYKQAAGFYERALTLEKENRTLPQNYWLVMVDNLGMSYGISGDRENARRVFRYGLSQEPTYPMFHYNLACAFAEGKQLDSALEYLSKAYAFKANMITGEEFPDPWKDKSFKRYWNNRKFEDLMSRVSKERE